MKTKFTASVVLAAALAAGLSLSATSARAVTLASYAGPTCSGTYVYVLPEVGASYTPASTSTGSDAMGGGHRGPGGPGGPGGQTGGQTGGSSASGTSSLSSTTGTSSSATRSATLAITNLDSASAANVTVCGYSAAAFIGGTSFSLAANNGLQAVDPAPSATSTTVISLATLLNGATIPTTASTSVVIASDKPLSLGSSEGRKGVGPVRSAAASPAAVDLAFGNLNGVLANGAGVICIHNPTASAVTFAITFYADDGSAVAATATQTVAAYSNSRLITSDLTSASGTALTLTSADIMHIVSTSGVLGGNFFPLRQASGFVGASSGSYTAN